MRGCGKKECMVSSTIAGSLSFGSGKLDGYGFWEFPCDACARLHEEECPEDGECWPYAQKNEEIDERR